MKPHILIPELTLSSLRLASSSPPSSFSPFRKPGFVLASGRLPALRRDAARTNEFRGCVFGTQGQEAFDGQYQLVSHFLEELSVSFGILTHLRTENDHYAQALTSHDQGHGAV
jgi:hypothetical protein